MHTPIGPLPETTKDEIIATQPSGIWLVLAEEQTPDGMTAEDLVFFDASPDPFA